MSKNKKKSKSRLTAKSADLNLEPSDNLVVEMPSWFKNKKFLGFIFFLLTFLTYFVSLNNQFIWDDVEVIQKSYYRIDRSNYFSGFVPSDISEKKLQYYRPILALSYIVDWKLWNLDPFGFHLTNSIIYSLTVVAFFLLCVQFANLYDLRRSLFFSLTATLVFLFHPMHVESVSWISGRTDVLCGLFFILSVYSHLISYNRKYFFILAALFLALSLLSKEVAVSLPFLVVGIDFLNGKLKQKESILKYCLYFGILFLYIYLRSRAFVTIPDVYNTEIESSPDTPHNIRYFYDIFKVLVLTYSYYLKQLMFPYYFNSFVTFLPSGGIYFTASIIVTISTSLIAIYYYFTRRYIITTGIFWILLTIGPSSLIAIFAFIATPVAERYLFVPSVGFCILLGYTFCEISDNRKYRRFGLILSSLIFCSYLIFCINRQSVWNDRVSFWKDVSIKSMNHAIPHINYGMALLDAGKTDEAIKEFNISLDPRIENTPTGRAIAANNLGVAYINLKQYGNAAKTLLIALKSDPSFYKTYYHFGLLYYIKANTTRETQDYLTSEKYLIQAVSLVRNYGKALLLLAKVNDEMGNTDKSRYYAKRALESGLVNELAVQAKEILSN